MSIKILATIELDHNMGTGELYLAEGKIMCATYYGDVLDCGIGCNIRSEEEAIALIKTTYRSEDWELHVID